MDWNPIETAPKDGSEIDFFNIDTGQHDRGYWCDYTIRGSLTGLNGEWSTILGNGTMTHWRPIQSNSKP